jgi:hypothetical protein
MFLIPLIVTVDRPRSDNPAGVGKSPLGARCRDHPEVTVTRSDPALAIRCHEYIGGRGCGSVEILDLSGELCGVEARRSLPGTASGTIKYATVNSALASVSDVIR